MRWKQTQDKMREQKEGNLEIERDEEIKKIHEKFLLNENKLQILNDDKQNKHKELEKKNEESNRMIRLKLSQKSKVN